MVRFPLRFAPFCRDISGSAVQRWAGTAGLIALGCVIAAKAADTAVKRGVLPEVVWRTTPDSNRFAQAAARPSGTIDYTVTASIAAPAAATRLDPCTGQTK